jgi:hypothetical protein
MCEFCGCAGRRNAKETKHETDTSGSSVTFQEPSRSMAASSEAADPRVTAEHERTDSGSRSARKSAGVIQHDADRRG